MKNIFLQKSSRNVAGWLIPDLFLFFKTALCKVKANGQHCSLNIFWYISTWRYNKNKLYNISGCWPEICSILMFLWKALRLALPPYFLYGFSRKIFFMQYSINWPNFVAWLPLLLEILSNMCIVIICCPV